MNRMITGSDGLHLEFKDEDLFREYEEALERLHVMTYGKIRDKYGIWAGNQGKFVRSRHQMNEWDSKHMEKLYDKSKNRRI